MSSVPYHFIRYVWIKRVDVERLANDLRVSFEVTPLQRVDPGSMTVSGHDTLEKFHVRADTLHVYLSPARATLFQKERRSFTEGDLKLRERVFAVYPHSRSTPFPWSFAQEPRFEVEPK
jgi:hypothetical protein